MRLFNAISLLLLKQDMCIARYSCQLNIHEIWIEIRPTRNSRKPDWFWCNIESDLGEFYCIQIVSLSKCCLSAYQYAVCMLSVCILFVCMLSVYCLCVVCPSVYCPSAVCLSVCCLSVSKPSVCLYVFCPYNDLSVYCLSVYSQFV